MTRPKESAVGGGDYANGTLHFVTHLTFSPSPAVPRQSARIRRS
jgi:hypothetical protein